MSLELEKDLGWRSMFLCSFHVSKYHFLLRAFYNGNHLKTILSIGHTLAPYTVFIHLLCPGGWLDCRLP